MGPALGADLVAFKDEPGRHGHFRLGSPILTDKDQSSTAIGYIENDRLAVPCLDRLHTDGEKLSHGLIEILDAQLGTDFGPRKFDAGLASASVEIGQGYGFGRKPELRRRDQNQFRLRLVGSKGERRSRKNLAGLVADMAPQIVQMIAQLERPGEGADRDGLPGVNIAPGPDNRLGRPGHASAGVELVLQEV